MTEDKELRRALDETLDAISDWPEEKIRATFGGQRIPHNVDFIWDIFGTEYTVVSHFDKDSENDMFKIVRRLLEGDATK
ncbi:MAG: hypothetical protein PHV32_10025 [Eubacteriales bacterium]|nr:hypothetical protein [Eubacteriales bacterium]